MTDEQVERRVVADVSPKVVAQVAREQVRRQPVPTVVRLLLVVVFFQFVLMVALGVMVQRANDVAEETRTILRSAVSDPAAAARAQASDQAIADIAEVLRILRAVYPELAQPPPEGP